MFYFRWLKCKSPSCLLFLGLFLLFYLEQNSNLSICCLWGSLFIFFLIFHSNLFRISTEIYWLVQLRRRIFSLYLSFKFYLYFSTPTVTGCKYCLYICKCSRQRVMCAITFQGASLIYQLQYWGPNIHIRKFKCWKAQWVFPPPIASFSGSIERARSKTEATSTRSITTAPGITNKIWRRARPGDCV